MKNKKKRFITKSNIRWKIIDFIVLTLIFLNSAKVLFTNDNLEELINVYSNADNIMVIIIWTIFLLFIIFISSFFYVAIYVGIRYGIKKFNKSKVTFDAKNDLEYYREKFNGISPATMSLLMDLNVESNKDLGAMRLYYELNDIYLYEKDGSLHLNNTNNIKINKSDDLLLNYFYDNKNKLYVLNEWKENVICEAVNNNLIKRKNNDEKGKVQKKGCTFFLLINLISLAFIIYFMSDYEYYFEVIDKIGDANPDNLQFLNVVTTNSEYMYCLIATLVFGFSFFLFLASIVSGIIFSFISSFISIKDKLKRTTEGNILAEKLYGMKNFINDFSNLDEATKKHLVLWKEFLIYAVVLEENDTILSEISNMYHTDLSKYKNYNN